MSEVKISAEPRTEFGKGGARRTRRAGLVPAVLYGHGEKPKHIALPAREFAAAIRQRRRQPALRHRDHRRHPGLALPKAIQRDPIRDTFEHVDLIMVRRGEKVTVDVPVALTGEAARDTLVVHEHDTLSVDGRRHQAAGALRGLDRGPGGRLAGHRRRRPAARGRRAGRRRRSCWSPRDRRADRRAARGHCRGRGGHRGGRGRGRRGRRGSEGAEAAEAESRRRGADRGLIGPTTVRRRPRFRGRLPAYRAGA